MANVPCYSGHAERESRIDCSPYSEPAESCDKVRGLVTKADGDEANRWRRRADAAENSRVIESQVAQEADRRVAIWLRVRLGGERMTTVAADYGYRDGSGIHRVVQRLENKAKDDQALTRHLEARDKHLSNVMS